MDNFDNNGTANSNVIKMGGFVETTKGESGNTGSSSSAALLAGPVQTSKQDAPENEDVTVVRTKGSRRIVMTQNDIRAAERLSAIWSHYKRENGVNQTAVAQHLGWSQGNFSQYITGKVPIGNKALKKLCAFFDCKPTDIRPELINILGDDHVQLMNRMSSVLQEFVSLTKNKEIVEPAELVKERSSINALIAEAEEVIGLYSES